MEGDHIQRKRSFAIAVPYHEVICLPSALNKPQSNPSDVDATVETVLVIPDSTVIPVDKLLIPNPPWFHRHRAAAIPPVKSDRLQCRLEVC